MKQSDLQLLALKVLERNKLWNKSGTNHKNSETNHGTKNVLEKNLPLLAAAKKLLERRIKPIINKKNNINNIGPNSCSTFSVSREWNSGTNSKNVVSLVEQKVDELFKNGKFLPMEQTQHLNLPEPWQLTLTNALTRSCPAKISSNKWGAIIKQLQLWIEQPEQLQEIIAKDWSLKNIFGCHLTHPLIRYDCMGLLMLIQNKTIIEVSSDWITLKTKSGAIQTHKRPLLPLPEQTTLDLLPDDTDLSPKDNVKTQQKHIYSEENYYSLEKEKELSYKTAGISEPEAQMKVLNDVYFKFIENKGLRLGDNEARDFIQSIEKLYPLLFE